MKLLLTILTFLSSLAYMAFFGICFLSLFTTSAEPGILFLLALPLPACWQTMKRILRRGRPRDQYADAFG